MRKSHDQRCSEIIQAALEILAEQGVGQATTAAIAERVGIAQPTVFRHFVDRDAIFQAAIQWVGAGMRANLDPLFEGTGPPEERLHRVITSQLAHISQHKGMPRLLFSDRLHLESPQLKETVQGMVGELTKRLEDLIREGVWEGRFPAVTEPATAAWQVVALMQGTFLRWSLFDFGFSLEDQGEELWRFVRGALGMAPEEDS